MVSEQIKPNKGFNTNHAGLAILKKELNEIKILNFLDNKCPKHSGFKTSEILTTLIFKNILGIKTYTETSEEFKEISEFNIDIDRTTLGRNIKKIGSLTNYNFYLSYIVKDILNKNKVNKNNLRIIVDETTIEVHKDSKTYQNASWVWDNAQSKLVWGYEVTIIGIQFKDIFLPIHFELGKMSKENLYLELFKIKFFTKANIVLFDGGFACDEFYENLTKSNFIFYSKVPKDWLFNNSNVDQLHKNIDFANKDFYTMKVNRTKNREHSNIEYSLCFSKNDKRNLITNNLVENISETAFKEFKCRWDIETCNDEIKTNFCFENLPIRNKAGIIGHILSCLIAYNLLSLIKLKFREELGNIFNKGFKKIIRFIICVKAKWYKYQQKIKLKLKSDFKFKWFFENYNLI